MFPDDSDRACITSSTYSYSSQTHCVLIVCSNSKNRKSSRNGSILSPPSYEINNSGSSSTGAVAGSSSTGAVAGSSSTGAVAGSSSTGAVAGSSSTGAVAGSSSTGAVADSSSTGAVAGSSSTGAVAGSNSTGAPLRLMITNEWEPQSPTPRVRSADHSCPYRESIRPFITGGALSYASLSATESRRALYTDNTVKMKKNSDEFLINCPNGVPGAQSSTLGYC
ncbi:hypothetical protein FHG87_001718 [Trinorchestia longiramus]|nr:hypothetical protein FHG87_001718 [Trinorchestia longiramus]